MRVREAMARFSAEPKAAAERTGTDREERKANRGHDRGRDDGRDDFLPIFGKKTEDTFKATADKNGTDDRRITVIGTDGGKNSDKGEADAHYNRKL